MEHNCRPARVPKSCQWGILAAMCCAHGESEVALAALFGLPTEYGVVVEVLQFSDSLSFDFMLPKLLHAEQLAKEKFEKEKVQISIYGAQARPVRKCCYCGKPGHVKAQCKTRQSNEKRSQKGFLGQTVYSLNK